MFDEKAVKALFQELATLHAQPKVETVGDVPYLLYKGEQPLDLRKAVPLAAPLKVSTLEALAEYRKVYDPDGAKTMFHISSAVKASLISLEHKGQPHNRAHEALAIAEIEPSTGFGAYHDPDTFTVWVLTGFEATDESRALLKATAGLKAEAVKTVESKDNGIAQSVVVSGGISLVAQKDVKPLWTLRPFRTFREVGQPESLFALRLKGGGDGKPPSVGLFEADGTAWGLDARRNIAEYLLGLCPGAVVLR